MSSKRSTEKRSTRRSVGKSRYFYRDGEWIDKEPGRENFYRYWYDAGSRRLRRETLGTDDLDEAISILSAKLMRRGPSDPTAPDAVPILSVVMAYLDDHASGIRAENAAKRACRLWIEYMNKRTADLCDSNKPIPLVGDFTLPSQHAYWKWLKAKDLSCKSISIYCSTIKAAINFAAKPRVVVENGREKEKRILSSIVYVCDSEDEISKVTGLPKSKPRDFMPTDKQIAAFIDAISDEHVFRYVIMALNTWARPEAICQLDVNSQVNFHTGMIDLNQPGRLQNRKVRPTIRLTDNLRSWLIHWNQSRPLQFNGVPVGIVDPRTIKKVAEKAGVPTLTRYTLRHYMATRIRRVPGIPVEREERAAWMGHTDPDHRTTEQWYESFDPDYLLSCLRATDAIMDALDGLTTRSLFAPGTVRGTRLTVVDQKTDDSTILHVGKSGLK